MSDRLKPGAVRDAILATFYRERTALTVDELHESVNKQLGKTVARSSVRSYLNINTPGTFERVDRGSYRLAKK